MRHLIQYLHGTALFVTGYRWSKYHRQNETWQYRYLHTTMSNIKADQMYRFVTGKEF